MNKLFMAFCAILISGLMACGADLSDAEYYAKAQKHYDKGELPIALVEVKNTLRVNSNHANARYLLGLVSLGLSDLETAEKELKVARKLGIADSLAVPPLARSLYLQQKYESVLNLPVSVDDPSAASDLMVTHALAYLSQGNPVQARKHIKLALELEPNASYALEGLARLEAASGNLQASREILGRILSEDDTYGSAWSVMAQVEQAEGNSDAAEQAYNKAIQYNSNPKPDMLGRALLLISTGKFEAAEADIQHLESLLENHIGVMYARGMLLYNKKEYEAAQGVFDQILARTDNYMPAILYAGATQLQLGHQITAESHLDQYVARLPDYPPANRMLAVIKLRKGEAAQAEHLLTLTLEEDRTDVLALSLLVQALLAQGQTGQAIEVLREIIALQPESTQTRLTLASILEQSGERAAAIDELKTAVSVDPGSVTPTASLVKLYIADANSEAALELANTFLEANPGSPTAHNLLGSTFLSLGSQDRASASFRQALALNPGDTSASRGMAVMAIKSGKPDQAKEYYLAALEKQPKHLNMLLDLATLEAAMGNKDASIAVLERAISAHPEVLEPRLRLGLVYLLQGRAGDVPGLMGDMRERYPRNIPLFSLLADSARASGQYRKALPLYRELVELAPNNARIRYALAKNLASLGERASYRETLLETLKLDPLLHAARLDYARELLAVNDIDGAQAQLDFLQGQSQLNTETRLMEGLIANSRGDLPAAASAYQAVFDRQPNNINLIRLADIKWRMAEQDSALALLNDWLAEYPEDVLTQLELANRYILLARDEEAISTLEKVISSDSKSPMAMNNLAWLLHTKDPGRALKLAEDAHELAPESGQIMDTLSMVLLAQDDAKSLPRALRLNERAQFAIPENPAIILHGAQIQYAAGNNNSAKKTLLVLLENNPVFPEREQAEQLQAKLQ